MEIYRCNRNCGCMRCRYRGIMGSVVLMTLGVLFLLENVRGGDLDFDRTFPVLMIAIGVLLILQRTASMEGHRQPFSGAPLQPVPPPPSAAPAQPASSSSAIEVRHE